MFLKSPVTGRIFLLVCLLAAGVGCKESLFDPDPDPEPDPGPSCPILPPEGARAYFPVGDGYEWTYTLEEITYHYGVLDEVRAITNDSGSVVWAVKAVECVGNEMNVTLHESTRIHRTEMSVNEDGSSEVTHEEDLSSERPLRVDFLPDGRLNIAHYTEDMPENPPMWYYPDGAADTLRAFLRKPPQYRQTGGEYLTLVRGVGLVHYADSMRAINPWARHDRTMQVQSFTVVKE